MGNAGFVGIWFAFVIAALAACGSDDDGGTPNSAGSGGTAGSGGGSGSGGSADAGQGLDCAGACAKMTAIACAKGPPSESLCVAFCNGTLNGTDQACATALQTLLDCLDETSVFACDAQEYPVPAGCEDESSAVNPCLPQT